MAFQDSAEFQRLLQEARLMGNNRNRNRRYPGQGQGQNQYRHVNSGMRPDGVDFYRPNGPQSQPSLHHRQQHGPRRPRPQVPPYRQRQHFPPQQRLPQSQPQFQQRVPPQVGATQQQSVTVPSHIRPVGTVPTTSSALSPPPPKFRQLPHNIFLDPRYLRDLGPPYYEENWPEKVLGWVGNGDKYQRPETSVEEGTGWMGDIEAPSLDLEEDRMHDILKEFNVGLEIARHLEETEKLLAEMEEQDREAQKSAAGAAAGPAGGVDNEDEGDADAGAVDGYGGKDVTDEHWWQ